MLDRREIADGMIIEQDVAVSVRDGLTVYADVYRPADERPAPPLIAWWACSECRRSCLVASPWLGWGWLGWGWLGWGWLGWGWLGWGWLGWGWLGWGWLGWGWLG